MKYKKALETALNKYEPITETGCWIWMGYVSDQGYGRIHYKGKFSHATRFFYEHHNGEIPEGLFVRHKCDNPTCVNPEHLELGTQKQNQEDMVRRNRQSKGEDRHSAILTESQAKEIKNSSDRTTDLAHRYNVSLSAICDIRKNRTWRHI